jgi:hypothetical protein
LEAKEKLAAFQFGCFFFFFFFVVVFFSEFPFCPAAALAGGGKAGWVMHPAGIAKNSKDAGEIDPQRHPRFVSLADERRWPRCVIARWLLGRRDVRIRLLEGMEGLRRFLAVPALPIERDATWKAH